MSLSLSPSPSHFFFSIPGPNTTSCMTDALYRAIARYSGRAIRHRSARTPSASTSGIYVYILYWYRERNRLAAFARNAWWKRVTSHLLHLLPAVSAFCRFPLSLSTQGKAAHALPLGTQGAIKRGQLFTRSGRGGRVFPSRDPLPAIGGAFRPLGHGGIYSRRKYRDKRDIIVTSRTPIATVSRISLHPPRSPSNYAPISAPISSPPPPPLSLASRSTIIAMPSIPSELIADVERIATCRRLLLLKQPDVINEPQWSNQCKDGEVYARSENHETPWHSKCAASTCDVFPLRTRDVGPGVLNRTPITVPRRVLYAASFPYKYECNAKRFYTPESV